MPGTAQTPVLSNNVRRVLTIEVPVSVILAERSMPIQNILNIAVGGIIEFPQRFDQELKLCVSNTTVARGQAVKIGENFGFRVTHIDSPANRLSAIMQS